MFDVQLNPCVGNNHKPIILIVDAFESEIFMRDNKLNYRVSTPAFKRAEGWYKKFEKNDKRKIFK